MTYYLPESLKQLLSLRKNTFSSTEEETRFLQYTVMMVAGIVTMISFGIYNWFAGRYVLCLIILLICISVLFGWSLLFRGKAAKSVYRGNSFLFCLLLIYIMNIGGEEHSMILWMYIFPLVVFFLTGRREGAIWTSLIWILTALYFFGPFEWEGKHQYGFVFSIRFLVIYTVISIITFFYENFRHIYRNELEVKNIALISEITKREKTKKSLRESETKYRAIYLQAAEGILLIDFQGDIVECNPQFFKMFGYYEKDLIGKNVFSLFHEKELERIPSQMNKLLSGETVFIERSIKTATGGSVLCEQSGRKVNEELIILLYRDITSRKRAEVALDKLAYIDGLTQIPNRRKFDIALDKEWRRMKRKKKPIGLIIADIDFFKQFNDIYGHQAGDDCLKMVASSLAATIHRPADEVARFGGEEFVILLPDTEYDGCEKIAEVMRENIEKLQVEHHGSKEYGVVTMSFGVAVLVPQQSLTPEDLLGFADRAMYLAKDGGRNKVHSNRL